MQARKASRRCAFALVRASMTVSVACLTAGCAQDGIGAAATSDTAADTSPNNASPDAPLDALTDLDVHAPGDDDGPPPDYSRSELGADFTGGDMVGAGDGGRFDTPSEDSRPADVPWADGGSDAGPDTATDIGPFDALPSTCPADVVCVDAFPFTHSSSTLDAPFAALGAYSCDMETDESGPERVYRVTVPAAGFLSAAVYDGAGVDVDVHILASWDAGACLARGHHDASADVEAGTYYVIVDTWVDTNGLEQAGDYRVDIGFTEPSTGPCDMQAGIMERVGDAGDHLVMPATGPVVLEAHLVTEEEPEPYPSTAIEELAEHYALSQARTGFVMYRDQPWAPLEGGSFYGAGISSPTQFPVLHEAWYINMYWTSESRPERGTRMILRLPGADRAVVVAAGYETGPGDLSRVGGTPEEPHFYLGTGHLSEMTLGIAADQELPLGPRWCDDGAPPVAPAKAIRYPTDRLHSPLTPAVVERLEAVRNQAFDLHDDVFMKVGASSFDGSSILKCFGWTGFDPASLDASQAATHTYFLGGDADGDDPFARDSLAALSGKTANWAVSGAPSPMQHELDALSPRFALVEYGTNDMQQGSTYLSALWGFADKLTTLVDTLLERGVIPVLHTNRDRLDVPSANLWVGTYNAVIRGLAQGRRIPLYDQHLALHELPDHGLGDGLHASTYHNGQSYDACDFTTAGLEAGANMRNLTTLDTLARLKSALVDGAVPPDDSDAAPTTVGNGSPGSPFVVSALPFADMRSTTDSPHANLDVYTGCGADQDESGPEYLYRFDVETTTRVRALVFDQGGVDIDVHLLQGSASEAACVARAHGAIETTLTPGTYYFALDSFVGPGGAQSGEFLFVLVTCDPADSSCDL